MTLTWRCFRQSLSRLHCFGISRGVYIYALSSSEYIVSNKENIKWCGRTRSWPTLRYFPGIFLVRMKETTGNINRNSWSRCRGSKQHLLNTSQMHCLLSHCCVVWLMMPPYSVQAVGFSDTLVLIDETTRRHKPEIHLKSARAASFTWNLCNRIHEAGSKQSPARFAFTELKIKFFLFVKLIVA